MLRHFQELIGLKTRRQLFLILIVFAAMVVLCYEIGERYNGFHDWNDAWFSVIAINHNTFGFQTTKFMNVFPFPADNHTFSYYINHPPLLGILLSFDFKILGVYEWSARLLAIFFSLGSIVLLYLLVRRIYDEDTALLSAFILGFLPMISYFGRMVCHEPLVLFFILTSLYGYRLWMENGKCRWALLMFMGFILGAMTDWPAYFLAPLITIHFLVITRGYLNRYNFVYILALPLIAAFLFILYIAYVAQVTGSADVLVNAFIYRTGSFATGDTSVTSPHFTMWEFAIQEMKRAAMYFTPVCSFLSALWLYNYIKSYINKEPHYDESYLLLLCSFGLLHVLVFKQGAWIHEYWLYYLSPVVAISSSIGLIYLHRQLSCFTSMKASIITHFTVLLFFTVWAYILYRQFYSIPGPRVALAYLIVALSSSIGLIYLRRQPSCFTSMKASIVTIFIVLLIFLVVALLFTVRIHSWDNPDQYELGTMLNKEMSLNESYMATQSSHGWFPQVVYYAKRYVRMVSDQRDFEAALMDPTKNYSYIVTETDPKDIGLKDMLFRNYCTKLGVDYRLFDLKKTFQNLTG